MHIYSGTGNKITNLSGFLKIAKDANNKLQGTFKSAKLYWGDDYGSLTNSDGVASNIGQNFDLDVTFTSRSATGTVQSHYQAFIISPTDGKSYAITAHARPFF